MGRLSSSPSDMLLFAVNYLLLCFLIAASGVSSRPNAPRATKLTDIVVFGDSISDNGRWYTLVKNAFHGTSPVPFDSAYYMHRFSNGPTWAEDLAALYGANLHNFAVSGATSDNTKSKGFTVTSNGTTFIAPSTVDQLQEYISSNLTSFSKARYSTTLFIIYIGGNDVLFNPFANSNDVSQTVAGIVSQLQLTGATKFLLGDQYDQSNMPDVAAQGVIVQSITSAFCSGLRSGISTLSTQQKTAHISTFALFGQVLANPKAYGFDPANIKKPCLVEATNATLFSPAVHRSVCSKPDTFVFFDGIHPTRKMHTIIAQHAKIAVDQRYFS